jgi:hypothetical protein
MVERDIVAIATTMQYYLNIIAIATIIFCNGG